MTAAATAETRTSHRATRVRVAPALAPSSLSRQVRDTYKLDLPATVKIHPVFHISLLEPTTSTEPISGHSQPPPPPVIIQEQQEWEVEKILDSQCHRNQIQYRVKWTGLHDPDRTWYHARNFENSPDLIPQFHEKYPLNQPPKTSEMCTTATVDTNEGWTFPNDNPKFPTTTKPDNSWGMPPTTPSPPLSAVGQPCPDEHASLYWTACYNDYCIAHGQMKDNNYYLRQSWHRWAQICNCPLRHRDELLRVTRERHLNSIKTCADWQRGKQVCSECRFLVIMDNHHLRCSAAPSREPLADLTPPQEDQEEIHADPDEAATVDAAIQEERHTLLGEIVTMIDQMTTQDARRNQVVHRTLAPCMNEFHDADQQQLQRMANTLETIVAKQQRINERLQAQQQASRPIRIHCTPIRHRPITTPLDLAGASIWTRGIRSRTWRDRLSGAAAGAAVTLATV